MGANPPQDRINRRHFVQTIGAVSISSVAGCSLGGDGDDDDGGAQLGERVPPIGISYDPDRPTYRNSIPLLEDSLEAIGAEADPQPRGLLEYLDNVRTDQREAHISGLQHTSVPDRLDPGTLVRRYSADWAGNQGGFNNANYANCEYTGPAIAQLSAGSIEEREDLISEALEIFASDFPLICMGPTDFFNVYNTTTVNPGGIGALGFDVTNVFSLIKSEPIGKDAIVASTLAENTATTNYMTLSVSPAIVLWSQLVNSTLNSYNEDLSLENNLANDIEIHEGGTQIDVELQEATAHNGDSITAEDVKFTFELIWNSDGAFPQAVSVGYTEIDVIDDSHLEFHFEEPSLPVVTREFPRWGILHKETWEGAEDNPAEFQPDPLIGTGPFRIAEFEQGESLRLTPHDGHPLYQPEHDVILQSYADETAAFEAFRAGSLDVVQRITVDAMSVVEDEMDEAEGLRAQGFAPFFFLYTFAEPPTKFREFRQAVGKGFDRNAYNAIVFDGRTEPQYTSCMLSPSHPWYPESISDIELEKFTEEPSGDPEGAKELLENSGWGWDDDGNLRYPIDADLTPLWPAGEAPSPEDFPCLED